MFKYYLYKIGLFIIYRLPLELSYKFAIFVSDLQYFFSFRDRRSVQNNLKKILPPDADLAWNTREVFRNFGRYLTEFFLLHKLLNDDYIKRKIKIENLHYINDVLARGKGGIILSAHIGNWELGGVLMSKLGFPMMAVALPHKERPVNDLFNKQREMYGMTIVPPNVAIRNCLERLRENQLVALIGDRDFNFTSSVMPFLGAKAVIPKGVAILAEKTGAGIIPAFLIRQHDNSFVLSVQEPIYPSGANSTGWIKDEVIMNLMERYLAVIEQKIRSYPTQWLMFREFDVK